ncbi:MAG TPA: hypothetical protein VHG93_18700 [Longimicrobium sp.]|nr:hypothetical protein [Longimicrobium sp.]
MKIALLALFAAAALLVSPRLAQRVYAQEQLPTCTVNCRNGSCSATGTCTCTCTFWTGTATCSCQSGGGGGGGGGGPDENMT